MPEFSLRYFKDVNGKPSWFRQFVPGIGPEFTPDPNKAARFPTELAAMASPAYSFALAPVLISDAPERTT